MCKIGVTHLSLLSRRSCSIESQMFLLTYLSLAIKAIVYAINNKSEQQLPLKASKRFLSFDAASAVQYLFRLFETALDWSLVSSFSKMVCTTCKLHTRNQNGEEESYRRSGRFDDRQWSTKNEEEENQKGIKQSKCCVFMFPVVILNSLTLFSRENGQINNASLCSAHVVFHTGMSV